MLNGLLLCDAYTYNNAGKKIAGTTSLRIRMLAGTYKFEVQQSRPLERTGPTVVSLRSGQRLRLFCISDVHTDYDANMRWLRHELPARAHGDVFDVAICSVPL